MFDFTPAMLGNELELFDSMPIRLGDEPEMFDSLPVRLGDELEMFDSPLLDRSNSVKEPPNLGGSSFHKLRIPLRWKRVVRG
jgi:hypothetical protein